VAGAACGQKACNERYNQKGEGGSSEAEEIAPGNAIEKMREGASKQDGQAHAQCHAAEYDRHSLSKD